jgi:phage shock protein C
MGVCTVQKRLYRSQRDHIIAGIASGLGDYFDVDPTIIRLVMVLLVFPGGAGLFLYLVGWVIIPPEPGQNEVPTTMFARSEALRRKVLRGAKHVEARLQKHKDADDAESVVDNATEDPGQDVSSSVTQSENTDAITHSEEFDEELAVGGPPDTSEEDERARRQRLGGILLIGVGFLFVLRNLFPWFSLGDLFPVFIIGLGVVLILRGLSE